MSEKKNNLANMANKQELNLFDNYKEEYNKVKYYYFKDINSKAKHKY